MRTLHADLTTAQQEAARTPYVRVRFDIPGSADEVFTTADSPARVKLVLDWEEPYGGGATIRISNYDQHFKTIDLRGRAVDIGWGFLCAGDENRYVKTRRVWVLNQRDISMEGELVTEFLCIDDWYRMAAARLINAGVKLTGTIVNGSDFVLGETITGSVSGATGKLALVGSDFIVVTSVSGTFQTANGGADDADGADASCDALTAVTSQSAAGGVIYNEDTTIINILKSVTSGIVDDVTLDEDDPDDTIDTYEPLIEAGLGTSVRWLVRQLLMMSKCGARIENDDELHVLYLDTGDAAQYSFDSDHAFLVDIREQAIIIPNKVYFVDNLPDSTGEVATYVGTAEDADSVAAIGTFSTIEVNPSIGSDAEAVALAEAWIAHRVAEAAQGRVIAPMECGLELYDMIEVADSRADVTVTARVGRIDRRFEPGKYEIELRLGGLLEEPGAGMPGQPDPVEWDIRDISVTTRKDRVRLRSVVYPWQLFQSIQPYVCDITFAATDKDTITWGAGTITFADGSTLSIDAETTGIDITTGWLYFTLGDSTLNYTTSFADCVAPNCGLVAFVAQGTETGATALVWPAAGKVPLLNADILTVMTLSALTANVGTLTAGIINGVTIYCGGEAIKMDADGIEIYGSELHWHNTPQKDLCGSALGFNDDLRIIAEGGAGSVLWLESEQNDILLDPGTYDVAPVSTAVDLGNATYYFDDINYSDLFDRTPSAKYIHNALAKIKSITIYAGEVIKKGVKTGIMEERLNRDTYPPELISAVTQEDIDKAEEQYQKRVRNKQAAVQRLSVLNALPKKSRRDLAEIRLMEKYMSREVVKLEPQPGVSMNATIGLLLSAIKELTERVEQLEG